MNIRLLASLAACVVAAPFTQAQTMFPDLAFTPTGTSERQNFPGSTGLFFTTNAPLLVSSLGYWDDNYDGVNAPLSVAIYEVSSGNIVTSGLNSLYLQFTGTRGWFYGPALADQNNPGGVSSGRRGSFRMDNLDVPIQLAAGSYALVAWGYNSFNQMGNAPEGGTAVNVNSFGGILTFDDTRYSDQPGVMPTSLDSMAPQYLTATFSPDIVIPEPGEYALMAGSAGLLTSWWLRRKRKQAAAVQPAA